jgi:hypothetical protein
VGRDGAVLPAAVLGDTRTAHRVRFPHRAGRRTAAHRGLRRGVARALREGVALPRVPLCAGRLG